MDHRRFSIQLNTIDSNRKGISESRKTEALFYKALCLITTSVQIWQSQQLMTAWRQSSVRSHGVRYATKLTLLHVPAKTEYYYQNMHLSVVACDCHAVSSDVMDVP